MKNHNINKDLLRKYNFWDAPPPNLGISRTNYLKTLATLDDSAAMIAIVGARRAGKSCIIRQFIDYKICNGFPPNNILYLNFFINRLREFRDEQNFETAFNWWISEIADPLQPRYVILDEVQELENWNDVVAGLVEDYVHKCKVIISGSNSKVLGEELTTKLSGRYHRMIVYPFSYREFKGTLDSNTPEETVVREFLKRGSLPEVALAHNQEVRDNLLESIKFSTLQKDIVERYNPSNPIVLQKLTDYIALNAGKAFSYKNVCGVLNDKLSKSDHISIPTLETYTSYLSNVYFHHSVPVYSVRQKDLLKRVSEKTYLNDWGFSNTAVGVDIGRILENLIFMELLKSNFEVCTYQAYRNKNIEIDFRATKSEVVLFIQVCYQLGDIGTTPQIYKRELGNLSYIKEPGERLLITMDEVAYTKKRLEEYKETRIISPFEFIDQYL